MTVPARELSHTAPSSGLRFMRRLAAAIGVTASWYEPLAAWASWLGPLAVHESVIRLRPSTGRVSEACPKARRSLS